MFPQKYKPAVLQDMIGNKPAISKIISWLSLWKSGNGNKEKEKALFLSGVCGIGKTLSVELILKHLDYHPIYFSNDEGRTKEMIQQHIRKMLHVKKSMLGQTNVLVFDDLDGSHDYGFIAALTDCIQETDIPILCICNNAFDQAYKTLKTHCLCVAFSKPPMPEMMRFLSSIVSQERIKMTQCDLKRIIEETDYDLRQTLIQLELFRIRPSANSSSVTQKMKDQTQMSIFEITKKIMNKGSWREKYDAYFLDADIIPLMIHENYLSLTFDMPKGLNKENALNHLSSRPSYISDMDLFETQKGTHCLWELSPYIACSGLQAVSKGELSSFPKFTSYLVKRSQTIKMENNLKTLSVKIKIYQPIKMRLDILPYLVILVFQPLVTGLFSSGGQDKSVIQRMVSQVKTMNLTNEDIQQLFNIINTEDYFIYQYEKLPTKVKTAITREFNATSSSSSTTKKKDKKKR